jgi:replicative DNA helicase
MEAESGVLGSVLLDQDAISRCDGLTPESFYDRRNAELFRHLLDMHRERKPMDALTIGEYLKKQNAVDKVGGYDRLIELQDATLVPNHISHYCDIVREKAEYRALIQECGETIENALSGASKPSSIRDALMVKLMAETPSEGNADAVGAILKEWDEATQGNIRCLPTPYPDLDRRTGGIRFGMNTLFCGRTKAGKSMFLASWYNKLGEMGIPIMAVPIEDKEKITLKRMAANLGGYNMTELDTGFRWVTVNGRWEKTPVRQDVRDLAKDCLKKVSEYPVHFYDKRCSPDELYTQAVRFKEKYGIQGMFLDGAKDLRRPSGKYNDTGFDEEISQNVCGIAEDLDVAVVSVHHLKKIPKDELIDEGHIRGSGNIVSDSRAVYALQSYGLEQIGVLCSYNEDGYLTTRAFECLVGNHGASGRVVLDSDLGKCRFWPV